MRDEIDPNWLPPAPADPSWPPPLPRQDDASRSESTESPVPAAKERWRWLAIVGGVAVGVAGTMIAVKMVGSSDDASDTHADATAANTSAAAQPSTPLTQPTTGPARQGVALQPNEGSDTIVRTTSGKTRCDIGADAVVCQYLPGFPQAPVEPPSNCPPPPGTYLKCVQGAHWDIAVVNDVGGFRWDIGNIPGAQEENDHVLAYGQTYQARGWTILPTIEGTRFTNDRTGHGMFVSIENVYSF